MIIPPLTNQYLNLTKNSSLAVAIGYPDLVSVFAGTTLSRVLPMARLRLIAALLFFAFGLTAIVASLGLF